MTNLRLHDFHQAHGANFGAVNGQRVVLDYGDARAEHAALRTAAGLLDLDARSRLCVQGADRARFLHGQVTNNVNDLRPGQGSYAALTTNKGKLQSDLNLFCLADELLLDFEPGLTALVTARLEKFIVADDVQVVDAAPHYALLSVQGPRAAEALTRTGSFPALPAQPFASVKLADAALGELYVMNLPRLNTAGFDVHVPVAHQAALAEQLHAAVSAIGGRAVGRQALETSRIEAGIPRFGADMDETTLPQEAGIAERAVSFTKGCYIGQEVINRIRSFGQVTRALRGLRLPDDLPALPARGNTLWHEGKAVGHITSAARSWALNRNLALGYVRKECNAPGTELTLRTAGGEAAVTVCALPFV